MADFGVDLYGPIDLATGLGASARGFARALWAADVPVHLVPTGEVCGAHTPAEHDLHSDTRRFALTIEHINADTTDAFMERFGTQLRGVSARVAVWYWELAAFRPDWISRARWYDEIWVASEFGRRAVAAMTNVPVRVVPPPMTLSPARGQSGREQFHIPEDSFVFLYVFDHASLVDRKNPFCLVDAFVAEFAGDPGACLVLKVSHVNHDAPAYQVLEEATTGHPNVVVVAEMLDEADLANLFEAADCYVSPHRSEGFGLTVAESMLRGRPVIATGYGATTDFVSAQTGYPIEYSLVEIEEDTGPYLRGHVWADPSREHLRRLLRQVVDDPAAARVRGEAGRRLMEERYSPAAAGARMRAHLLRLHEAALRG
jgi:glycosyltransferase involved in cell wall biosynthesis